ncbi:MAG: hypothetical protein CFE21_07455 [Bacteroidetes bacterium B1(2017)]|nr:MAG: hypothetical protein CFE21_07455 [Bacteroidetes bacterium B1(2017)]
MKSTLVNIILFCAVIFGAIGCHSDHKSKPQISWVLFEPVQKFEFDSVSHYFANGMLLYSPEADSGFMMHLINPKTGEPIPEEGFKFYNSTKEKELFKHLNEFAETHPSYVISAFKKDEPARIYDGSDFLLLRIEDGKLSKWYRFLDHEKPAYIDTLTQLFREYKYTLNTNTCTYKLEFIDSIVERWIKEPELKDYFFRPKPKSNFTIKSE